MKHKSKSNFFAKIPNDDEGRYFLFLLNKYLNKESYLIRKRGRWPNHELIKKEVAEGTLDKRTRFRNSVPEKYALAFNLYLCARREKNMCPVVIGISTYLSDQRRWAEINDKEALIEDLEDEIYALDVEIARLKGKEQKREVQRIETDFAPRYDHLKENGGL